MKWCSKPALLACHASHIKQIMISRNMVVWLISFVRNYPYTMPQHKWVLTWCKKLIEFNWWCNLRWISVEMSRESQWNGWYQCEYCQNSWHFSNSFFPSYPKGTHQPGNKQKQTNPPSNKQTNILCQCENCQKCLPSSHLSCHNLSTA